MKQKIMILGSAAVSMAAQISLPFAVAAAYFERGYFAVGGEYALAVISVLSMFICLHEGLKMYIDLRERHKDITRKYICKMYEMANMNVQEKMKEHFEDIRKAV